MQIPLKVPIEETIKDGIYTGGDHCCQKTKQKDWVVAAVHYDFMIPVCHSIKDVERKPTHCKCHHYGNQHDVDSFGLSGPALILSHLVHHDVSSFKANINL